jgi:hypothetical protein
MQSDAWDASIVQVTVLFSKLVARVVIASFDAMSIQEATLDLVGSTAVAPCATGAAMAATAKAMLAPAMNNFILTPSTSTTWPPGDRSVNGQVLALRLRPHHRTPLSTGGGGTVDGAAAFTRGVGLVVSDRSRSYLT